MLIIPIVELDNSYYKDLIIPIINEFDLVNWFIAGFVDFLYRIWKMFVSYKLAYKLMGE